MAMFRQRQTVLALLSVLLIFGALHVSFAASGGVIGGSASSGSSSSSSDDHSSYHHSDFPRYSDFSRTQWRTDYSDGTGISDSDRTPHEFGNFDLVFVLVVLAAIIVVLYLGYRAEMNHSVLVIQVGLSGEAKSVQKELNRTAKYCDTTTAAGLNHILKVSSDLLLHNIYHCVSAYTSVNQKLSWRSMSKLIDQLSNEERAQFDIETLVNIDGIKSYRPLTTIADGSANTDFLVVTILVAVKGSQDLPVLDDRESLRETLACLRSIGISETKKVFVFWTPQNKEDHLSEEEVTQKYPYLRPLQKYAVD